MKSIFYLIISLLFILFSCNKKNYQLSEQPYNVLFIAVDDLRPELNLYGNSHIISPNLDKLASGSAVFDRAFCNVPVCGASRASVLTGARPTRYRFLTYNTRTDEDLPSVITLPMLFKQNGYTTISNGKIFHHQNDDSLAWDYNWFPKGNIRDYQLEENIKLNTDNDGIRGNAFESANVPDSAYFDGRIANKGINDLRKLKKSKTPFFLALGFMKPHLPFNAPSKYWRLYEEKEIKFPKNYKRPASTPKEAYHNSGELRSYYGIPKEGDIHDSTALKMIRGYYACVSYVDAQIGRVLQELDRLDLSKNTIVIVWGDHGYNLANHKMWCKHCNFNTSLRVPLLIKVPGLTSGNHIKAITEYIDIYPTLCELAKIPQPDHLEGESLVPVFKKNGHKEKNYAISKYGDGITLIKDQYYYTEWTDNKGEMYARMLFDHTTDSLELNNLAEKSEYNHLVTKLSKELHEKWGKDFLVNTATNQKIE